MCQWPTVLTVALIALACTPSLGGVYPSSEPPSTSDFFTTAASIRQAREAAEEVLQLESLRLVESSDTLIQGRRRAVDFVSDTLTTPAWLRVSVMPASAGDSTVVGVSVRRETAGGTWLPETRYEASICRNLTRRLKALLEEAAAETRSGMLDCYPGRSSQALGSLALSRATSFAHSSPNSRRCTS